MSNDFLIPKFSIVSVVFRIPAVSIKRKLNPPIIKVSSIASLVVPAISDTIALSSFNKQFSRVDLPTFGDPRIATGIPFFITFPKLKDSINLLRVFCISDNNSKNFVLSANSTSSSAKSSSNSIKDAKSISCVLSPCSWFENPPLSCSCGSTSFFY